MQEEGPVQDLTALVIDWIIHMDGRWWIQRERIPNQTTLKPSGHPLRKRAERSLRAQTASHTLSHTNNVIHREHQTKRQNLTDDFRAT